MIKIKNWDEFQHFKDRNPPWIKLYKTVLERRDIAMISDCNFRILVGLWILASEDETRSGTLPEIADISFRLRKTEKQITQSLQELKEFLIFDDINTISDRYQDCIPETETETETEEEEDIYKKGVRKNSEISFEDLTLDHTADWLARKRAQKKYLDVDEERQLEKFKDYCRANNPKYKDHIAAFRNSFDWKGVAKHESFKPNNYGGNRKSKSEQLDDASRRAFEKLGLVESQPNPANGAPVLRQLEHLREGPEPIREYDFDVYPDVGGI